MGVRKIPHYTRAYNDVRQGSIAGIATGRKPSGKVLPDHQKIIKGGHPSARELRTLVGDHPICASRAVPKLLALPSDRSRHPVLPVHLPQMRPPSLWSGSIWHLPPIQGGLANQDGVWNQVTGLIPPPVSLRLISLSIVLEVN